MSTSLLFVIFFLLYLLLVWKSGKVFPVLYLCLFTYFIQYIFSTHLIYYEYPELRATMPISADRYFDFAYPAIIAMFLGILLFNRDVDIRGVLSRIDKDQARKLGYWLLAISLGFDVMGLVGVPGVSSLLSFTRDLKLLAAFCFLFVGTKTSYLIIALLYIQLAYNVLRAGVFINFLIWGAYLYFFVMLKYKASFLLRTTFIVIAVPLLVLIQSIKSEYRKMSWSGKASSGIGLFTELAGEKISEDSDDPFAQSEGVVSMIERLTEGWHLALTLRHVPAKQPFSDGEEFITDVISSFIPRVIVSDKKVVGTQDKFYKYTGHRLLAGTSMSIGIWGDFYINFGATGAVIALFLLGVVVAKFIRFFVMKYVLPTPINIIWIPFVLNYLIRAGNDFYAFFNGTTKGFILFLIVNYYFQRSLKKNKNPQNAVRFNPAN